MKNSSRTIIKISVIFLCACLAVATIMIYMKTRMQPPKSIQYVNQYVENIRQVSSNLSDIPDEDLELTYKRIHNRISLFKSESLIAEDQKTECIKTFSSSYVSAFRKWCEKKFMANVWKDSDHVFMRKRISDLRSKGELGDVDKVKLKEVEKVLNDYRNAWSLGSDVVTSSSDSKNKIAKGKQYQNDNYLSHCTALVDYLKNLPSKLYQSHRSYVSNRVSKLFCVNYKMSQIAQWGEDYKAAQSLVNDFNNNVNALYGKNQESFGLDDQFKAARYYFKEKINSMSRFDDNYSTAVRDYNNVF